MSREPNIHVLDAFERETHWNDLLNQTCREMVIAMRAENIPDETIYPIVLALLKNPTLGERFSRVQAAAARQEAR